MMTINKSKVIIISIFLMIFFGGSIFHVHEASAEMKKVAGTSEILKNLVTHETILKDTRVRLINKLHLFSSADPDWDKARIFSMFFYVNPSLDGDDYKGCLAITHQNGDQTFAEYAGSWKWAIPKDDVNWTAESKGYLTGGTGKFDGIRGTFTNKVVGKGQNYVSSNWELEYEIK